MKPYGALTPVVDCDFSAVAFEEAMQLIEKERVRLDIPGQTQRFLTIVLGVESDSLIQAINLAQAHGMRVQLRHTYEWDEWGIEAVYLGEKTQQIKFWSPGA